MGIAEKGKWTKHGFSVGLCLGDHCGGLENLRPEGGRVSEVETIMPHKDTIVRASSRTTDYRGRYPSYFG